MPLITALNIAGYRKGLTYQSMPYDFRLSMRLNGLNKIFKKNLKRINKITQKKVIIVSHSLGGVNVLNQLSKINQEEKDKMIAFWISQGTPFLGAIKTTRILLSGLHEFYFKIFGFHFKPSVKVTSSHPVYYELLYKNPFKIYKDHSWFQWVEDR